MPRLQQSIRKEWGLRLNDSTQYITHSDNAAYDVLDNISLSMWFKRSTTGKDFLMSKGTNGFGMYIEPANRLVFTKPNVADLVTGKKAVVDQAWHQVVMTLGGGTASIYLDGVLDNSAATGTTFAATATGLFIGQDSGNLFHFGGSVKDVRVNNGLWSSDDVRNLYTSGPNTTLLTSNLILWDKVNDGTGTTVTDSSTTANNGTITGLVLTGATPTTMWTIDPVRPQRLSTTDNVSSVLFNGSSDKVVIADNAALDFGTGDFTIECKFYVKRTSTSNFNFIVAKRDTGTFLGYNFDFYDTTAGVKDKMIFTFDDSQYALIASNVPFNQGMWYHLIVTVDRDSLAGFKLFANGVSDNMYIMEVDYDSTVGTIDNAVALDFAHRNAANFMLGGLYDVRMYNRALTDDECLSRYYSNENITSSRVGWWKMDEATGSSIADSQGSNTGTITGGAWVLNTQS